MDAALARNSPDSPELLKRAAESAESYAKFKAQLDEEYAKFSAMKDVNCLVAAERNAEWAAEYHAGDPKLAEAHAKWYGSDDRAKWYADQVKRVESDELATKYYKALMYYKPLIPKANQADQVKRVESDELATKYYKALMYYKPLIPKANQIEEFVMPILNVFGSKSSRIKKAAMRVDPGHVAAVKAAAAKNAKKAELAAERAERAEFAKLDAESAAVELDAKKAAAAKLAKLDAESAAASTTAATKNDATGDTNNPLHPYNKTVAIQSDGTGYTNNPLHPYNKTVATAAETRNNQTVAIQSDGTGDTKPTTAATKPTNTNFVTRMLTAGTSTTNNTTIDSYITRQYQALSKNTQRSKS